MPASQHGFSFTEVLVSMLLLLGALLVMGELNMTSLNLIGRGKINQKAALLLLDKIEQIRSTPIEELRAGEFEDTSGVFSIQWSVQDHVPYVGTKQIRCRILYVPATTVIAESIFYRSE